VLPLDSIASRISKIVCDCFPSTLPLGSSGGPGFFTGDPASTLYVITTGNVNGKNTFTAEQNDETVARFAWQYDTRPTLGVSTLIRDHFELTAIQALGRLSKEGNLVKGVTVKKPGEKDRVDIQSINPAEREALLKDFGIEF